MAEVKDDRYQEVVGGGGHKENENGGGVMYDKIDKWHSRYVNMKETRRMNKPPLAGGLAQ